MQFRNRNVANWAGNDWVVERKAFLKRSIKPFLIATLIMFLIATVIDKTIRIGWDPQQTSCLPWTFYLFSPVDDVEVPYRGQLVRVNLPKTGPGHLDKVLADRFAKGVPGGGAKIVVGMPGDLIRIKNNWLVVNEEPWGFLWLLGSLGLQDKGLDKEYRVPDGEYLVLGTTPESYDGRYWGTVKQKDILGSIRVIL